MCCERCLGCACKQGQVGAWHAFINLFFSSDKGVSHHHPVLPARVRVEVGEGVWPCLLHLSSQAPWHNWYPYAIGYGGEDDTPAYPPCCTTCVSNPACMQAYRSKRFHRGSCSEAHDQRCCLFQVRQLECSFSTPLSPRDLTAHSAPQPGTAPGRTRAASQLDAASRVCVSRSVRTLACLFCNGARPVVAPRGGPFPCMAGAARVRGTATIGTPAAAACWTRARPFGAHVGTATSWHSNTLAQRAGMPQHAGGRLRGVSRRCTSSALVP